MCSEVGQRHAIHSFAGLERSQLEHKVRLLSLATLGFQNIGQDLPYSTIASTLQVEQSDVERWVIDGSSSSYLNEPSMHLLTLLLYTVVRAGLLSGRLSQTSQTLHVTRAGIRTFERPQWELLEKRLLAWKTGLAGVLDVIADARKKSATEAVASTSTASPAGIEVPTPAPQAAAAVRKYEVKSTYKRELCSHIADGV